MAKVLPSFLLIVFVFFAHGLGLGGEIDPDLAAKIARAGATEMISVVVSVEGEITADSLKHVLDATCKTLAERHRVGITMLREAAARTQGTVLAELAALEKQGLAANIKPYWIIDAVSADLAASEISRFASRSDVAGIYQSPQANAIIPDDIPPEGYRLKQQAGVEDNLKVIGADSAWAMGYTGKGRLVCSFESGADVRHPALNHSWKGNDGDTAAAWCGYDPAEGLPENVGYHGTHTTGIMVGHDDITGDTIGVAPGARWIATTGRLISQFEWAVDPDGNPNTSSDVPDVINHSWGMTCGCPGAYARLVDIAEALGIVNVFAAGNDGPEPMTILYPACRVKDSLTNFSVGSINHLTGDIAGSSAHGPSPCDGVTIKPALAAPGAWIRSAGLNGGYEYHGGTSMSAPHVAGAVAILRQCAPDATADQIKQALIAGATPAGDGHPNNTFGWGVLNIPASLEYLGCRCLPDLKISAFDYSPVEPGDTVRAHIALTNVGCAVDSVYARFPTGQNGVKIITDSLYFGAFAFNDTVAYPGKFRVAFSDTIFPGSHVPISYALHGSGGFSREGIIHVNVGIAPAQEYYTHKNAVLQFTISNFGAYGFGNYSDFSIRGQGFRYGDTTGRWSQNILHEAAFMIGTDPAHISDCARDSMMEPDRDFRILIDGELAVDAPGKAADQETFAAYDDAFAERPLGLAIRQRTYSWLDHPDDDYVIMEFVITNSAESIITDINAGLFFDWVYWGWHGVEGNFSRPENLGYNFYHYFTADVEDSLVMFRGLAVLNPEGVQSYRLIIRGRDVYANLTETAKFDGLAGGITDTSLRCGYDEGLRQFLSTGSFSLAPGQSDSAVFAVMGADNLDQLKETARQAYRKYREIVAADSARHVSILNRFALYQNYPNPFNPATVIRFHVVRPGPVTLTIYNILGQKIRTLIDRPMAAGNQEARWDGLDNSGRQSASGIYLYRLVTSNYDETRKMILLR
ncbi:MAG: S8 family serine peptidase [candidate division Zixibacteria bacterium]|nr:S8 family serine peptidase [candidate division Zixibacteria bacterium]